MRFADMFRHYSRVARLEYLPAEAPALFAPLLLGIMVAGELHMLRAAEGVLVFSLLFFAGFIINALTDQEVDQKCKTYVADSSRSIGKKGLAALVIFQCSLAMLITVHLALEMAVWWLVPLVGLGIFLGIGYSVPPLHFKVRGIGHAIALSLSAFFIPFFFLFFVVAGTVNPWILLLLIGVSITHYGLALTNQSGDYMEDKDTGLATPAVRWGLRPTLKIAAVLMIIGIPFTTVSLAHIARGVTSLGTPIFADGFLGLLALEGWHVITALVLSSLVLGYSVSLRGINDLLGLVGDEEPSYGMMDGVKNRMNYPFWQASSVWGAVAAVGLVFALVLTSPAVIPMMDTEEGASLELTVSSTDPVFSMEGEDVSATMNISVSPSLPLSNGMLVVRVQSWSSGLLMNEESAVLGHSLEENETWELEMIIGCHREEDTAFTMQVLAPGENEEEPLWRGRTDSLSPLYISSCTYTAAYPGLVDRHANVTVTIFADREVVTNGELAIIVESYTSMGMKMDEETISLDAPIPAGENRTVWVIIDVPDIGGTKFHVELLEIIDDSIKLLDDMDLV